VVKTDPGTCLNSLQDEALEGDVWMFCYEEPPQEKIRGE